MRVYTQVPLIISEALLKKYIQRDGGGAIERRGSMQALEKRRACKNW